jgi:hypothetical protein
MLPIIHLPLLPGWQSHQETLTDHDIELAHLEAYLPDDKKQTDRILADVYAGPLPEGSSAEQEALHSYQDIVGDGEEDPLLIWPFQGKEAYGYEVICDDDAIMRVMCVEAAPGQLLILNVVAQDDDLFDEAVCHLEKNLTVEF